MKKRYLLVGLLVLVLVVALTAVACGEKEQTTTTAGPATTAAPTTTTAGPATTAAPTTTAAPPTTAAPEKVIELTFNDHNPPDMPVSNALVAYAKYIEEQAGGRVKINVVLGGALFLADEVLRALQTGTCDAGTYVMTRTEGFYVNDVISLPFLGWPDRDETTEIYRTLLSEFPEMRAEWGDATYRAYGMMPPVQMQWTKKQVKTVADIKGMKSFCAEQIYADTFAALGGVPVDLDIADMYTAVERGVVQGVVNHANVCFVFGAWDLLKSHTVFGEGGISMAPVGVAWSNKSYNALPPDIQKIVDDAGAVWYKAFMDAENPFTEMVIGKARERGDTFIELTPDEIAVFREAIRGPVLDKWMNEASAKGLPAQAIYDRTLELAASYQ